MTTRSRRVPFVVFLVLLVGPCAPLPPAARAQEGSATDLQTHVGNLGSLDYPTRMNAARQIRRAPAAAAVPVLVEAARSHRDEYVRYRALVLLTGFNDRGTPDLMRELMRDRNDRIREVVYKWLEQHPNPRLLPNLLAALQTELAEFVRPALVSALAAVGSDPQVQRALLPEIARGLDFFRSAVIEALGRHRSAFAADAIAAVAKLEGPLQDDAVLALGRIGDARGRSVIARIEKGSGDVMVAVRVANCLLGEDCAAHIAALADAAAAEATVPSLRHAAASGLAALASHGHGSALNALLRLGTAAPSAREAAIGLGTVAVRAPRAVLDWLVAAPEDARAQAIELLKDGFDLLEEEYAEEQFFTTIRAGYWSAGEDSPTRAVVSMLIQKLEF